MCSLLFSFAVLKFLLIFYSIRPITLVRSPVSPKHLAITMPIVIFEHSLIPCAILPTILSISTLLIIHVAAFVRISMWHHPLPISMSQTWKEISIINGSILPIILSVSFGSIIVVVSNIQVTIRELLHTNAHPLSVLRSANINMVYCWFNDAIIVFQKEDHTFLDKKSLVCLAIWNALGVSADSESPRAIGKLTKKHVIVQLKSLNL